jgi:hypothetical protein
MDENWQILIQSCDNEFWKYLSNSSGKEDCKLTRICTLNRTLYTLQIGSLLAYSGYSGVHVSQFNIIKSYH